ncbi:16S rRNA (cytosine(967)-C(5))-methyltransferase RsmB [Pantoea sp. Nvir]|uniref:16S rRNA (cytosine(967)-C(5))-methyltransferase RsmB n=1 Tax=Pantoea sp. Nvir TaxID=2576760 RepID=UPI0027F82E0C|nr:16S rRNA (cytosine(967)-C(5))-methyltransferase RsmB [Pantoea sp. Nvir]CAJ0993488.1 Ribosomal RNA small subunit methyltransferase B [Pantoea sp. Nvir]
MIKSTNLRSLAAQLIERVIDEGVSLSTILPDVKKQLSDKNGALVQEFCFGVLRTLPQLETLICKLMKRPLTDKYRVLHYLIMVGIYQLIYTRVPAHAALAETVAGAEILQYSNFKGLLNGVLRQFQRQQVLLMTEVNRGPQRHLHPTWLLQRLKKAWPGKWQQIIEANNQYPPMWVRVNRQYHSRDSWLTLLIQSGNSAVANEIVPDALRLESPSPVSKLPGFAAGWVTVQDLSAQRCALLLEPENGEQILDLCAAPGGKTTHIFEIAPEAHVMAVDVDAHRLECLRKNLQRLNMHAEVKQGDGRTPEAWCGGRQFDRILLDAPCSATGVIRRHPDIKWLRRNRDISKLATLQRDLLEASWMHLKPRGTLLYATCSVLPEENEIQIKTFLRRHTDARAAVLQNSNITGLQIFPTIEGGDGFFYAKLVKVT